MSTDTTVVMMETTISESVEEVTVVETHIVEVEEVVVLIQTQIETAEKSGDKAKVEKLKKKQEKKKKQVEKEKKKLEKKKAKVEKVKKVAAKEKKNAGEMTVIVEEITIIETQIAQSDDPKKIEELNKKKATAEKKKKKVQIKQNHSKNQLKKEAENVKKSVQITKAKREKDNAVTQVFEIIEVTETVIVTFETQIQEFRAKGDEAKVKEIQIQIEEKKEAVKDKKKDIKKIKKNFKKKVNKVKAPKTKKIDIVTDKVVEKTKKLVDNQRKKKETDLKVQKSKAMLQKARLAGDNKLASYWETQVTTTIQEVTVIEEQITVVTEQVVEVQTELDSTMVKSASKTVETELAGFVKAQKSGLAVIERSKSDKEAVMNKFIVLRNRPGVTKEQIQAVTLEVKEANKKHLEARKALDSIGKKIEKTKSKVNKQKMVYKEKKSGQNLIAKMKIKTANDKKIKESNQKLEKAKAEYEVAKQSGNVLLMEQYSKMVGEATVVIHQTTEIVEEMEEESIKKVAGAANAKALAKKVEKEEQAKAAEHNANAAKTKRAHAKLELGKLKTQLETAKKNKDGSLIDILVMQVGLADSEVLYHDQMVGDAVAHVTVIEEETVKVVSEAMNNGVEATVKVLDEAKKNVENSKQEIKKSKFMINETRKAIAQAAKSNMSPQQITQMTLVVEQEEARLPQLYTRIKNQQNKISKGIKAKAKAVQAKHKQNVKNSQKMIKMIKEEKKNLLEKISKKRAAALVLPESQKAVKPIMEKQIKMYELEITKMGKTLADNKKIMKVSADEYAKTRSVKYIEEIELQVQVVNDAKRSLKNDKKEYKKTMAAVEAALKNNDVKLKIRLEAEAKALKAQIKMGGKSIKSAINKKNILKGKSQLTDIKNRKFKVEREAHGFKKQLRVIDMEVAKMRSMTRLNPSVVKVMDKKIDAALRKAKGLKLAIKKNTKKALKIQGKLDTIEKEVTIKSIVNVIDSDKRVKHARAVGEMNERLARRALEKAMGSQNTLEINKAKMNLKKARIVKELTVKKAEKETSKTETKHRKRIQKDLKKSHAKLDTANKIRKSAAKKINKLARAINKLSLTKGNEEKIKSMKVKMVETSNIKSAAGKMKAAAKIEIMERLTPIQQKLMRTSKKDPAFQIQRRILEDSNGNVDMITQTVTVYEYQMDAINKKMKELKNDPTKTKLDAITKTNTLTTKKMKLARKMATQKKKKAIAEKKAKAAKANMKKMNRKRMYKVYNLDNKINAVYGKRTRYFEKLIKRIKKNLNKDRIKVTLAKNHEQRSTAQRLFRVAKEQSKHRIKKIRRKMKEVMDDIIEVETLKVVSPEISIAKVRSAYKRVKPESAIMIIEHVHQIMEDGKNRLNKKITEITEEVETITGKISENFALAEKYQGEIQELEANIANTTSAGQLEAAKTLKRVLFKKKVLHKKKKETVAKLKRFAANKKKTLKGVKLQKVNKIKKIANNKKLVIAARNKMAKKAKKTKKLAKKTLAKDKKKLAKARKALAKAKTLNLPEAKLAQINTTITSYMTSVKMNQMTITSSTTEISNNKEIVKAEKATNKSRSKWSKNETEVLKGAKKDWMSVSTDVAGMTTVTEESSSTTTVSSDGSETTTTSFSSETTTVGRRRLSVTPEQMKMIGDMLGKNVGAGGVVLDVDM